MSDSSSASESSTATVTAPATGGEGEGEGEGARTLPDSSSSSASVWSACFRQELYFDTADVRHHVYVTPPSHPTRGPLFICHHGAGASGLSFAAFAKALRELLPHAGVLSVDARDHGASVIKCSASSDSKPDFSISVLRRDLLSMIQLTRAKLGWAALPPCLLVGHSLGGAVVTDLAHEFALGPALIGYCVIDVVEGSAIDALKTMQNYLVSRPSTFPDGQTAIEWHLRTRTIRNRESAEISVPSLLRQLPSRQTWCWRTDLASTSPYWNGWFAGMSKKFLAARGGKLLLLAGTDRLDRELMIGQMQGKFQLQVFPEAGHFVQEDSPEKTAELIVEFYRRNDGGSLVLPPKVSELLAMGKKV